MAGLLDMSSWKLDTPDLIQQFALLLWLGKGDDHKALLERITQARVVNELYNRVSSQRDTDALQQYCIMSIVAYIQKHPRATEADLIKEITKQIEIFKEQLKSV